MRFRLLAISSAAVITAGAQAGPNVPLDDPAWILARDQMAAGSVPDQLGGVQWMDDEAFQTGFWTAAAYRVRLLGQGADEHDRPYSLPLRSRDLAGGIALSCEYQEGRPCGDGAGGALELDSAAGWGNLLAAATRLRAAAGTANVASELAVDRAYLKFQTGPFAVQVGRDTLALGPSARAGLMVSRNAAPQDGIRAQLRPIALPLVPATKISFFYFLDRLRDPQRFEGTLLDCTRAQLDFADRVQLGGSRLLQLGGRGAPDYGGFWGFIGEHFGREGTSAAENNRLSFDLAVRLTELRGARAYYEIAFEDTRKAFWNSVQYDADHLLGIEVRALAVGLLRRAFLELEHTGWVSQEHVPFTTGMTNAGRTLGSALGPDGTSLWLKADLQLGYALVSPWTEWMRFVSDRYDTDQERGVFVIARGPIEHRQRIGADLLVPLRVNVMLSATIFGERIGNADLQIGTTRYSGGIRAAFIWTGI